LLHYKWRIEMTNAKIKVLSLSFALAASMIGFGAMAQEDPPAEEHHDDAAAQEHHDEAATEEQKAAEHEQGAAHEQEQAGEHHDAAAVEHQEAAEHHEAAAEHHEAAAQQEQNAANANQQAATQNEAAAAGASQQAGSGAAESQEEHACLIKLKAEVTFDANEQNYVNCVDDEVVTFYPGCRDSGRTRHDCNDDSEHHCDANFPEVNVKAKLTVCIHD
jgi:hypothetical protein